MNYKAAFNTSIAILIAVIVIGAFVLITTMPPLQPPPTIIDAERVIEPEPVKPVFTGY